MNDIFITFFAKFTWFLFFFLFLVEISEFDLFSIVIKLYKIKGRILIHISFYTCRSLHVVDSRTMDIVFSGLGVCKFTVKTT